MSFHAWLYVGVATELRLSLSCKPWTYDFRSSQHLITTTTTIIIKASIVKLKVLHFQGFHIPCGNLEVWHRWVEVKIQCAWISIDPMTQLRLEGRHKLTLRLILIDVSVWCSLRLMLVVLMRSTYLIGRKDLFSHRLNIIDNLFTWWGLR